MNNGAENQDEPKYRLAWWPHGELLLYDGPKKIEIGCSEKKCNGRIEITLYAKTIERWEYPHSDEPIDDDTRKLLVEEAAKLQKARSPLIDVVINWTVRGGDRW